MTDQKETSCLELLKILIEVKKNNEFYDDDEERELWYKLERRLEAVEDAVMILLKTFAVIEGSIGHD